VFDTQILRDDNQVKESAELKRSAEMITVNKNLEMAKLDMGIVVPNVLELGRQVRSVILQSNPKVEDGLKTAGELFEIWLYSLPKEVKKELGLEVRIEGGNEH